MELGGLRGGGILEVENCGFGGGMELTILWRGYCVHLPEIGSLGYSGFDNAIVGFSTGVSVGGIWKLSFECVGWWSNRLVL